MESFLRSHSCNLLSRVKYNAYIIIIKFLFFFLASIHQSLCDYTSFLRSMKTRTEKVNEALLNCIQPFKIPWLFHLCYSFSSLPSLPPYGREGGRAPYNFRNRSFYETPFINIILDNASICTIFFFKSNNLFIFSIINFSLYIIKIYTSIIYIITSSQNLYNKIK